MANSQQLKAIEFTILLLFLGAMKLRFEENVVNTNSNGVELFQIPGQCHILYSPNTDTTICYYQVTARLDRDGLQQLTGRYLMSRLKTLELTPLQLYDTVKLEFMETETFMPFETNKETN